MSNHEVPEPILKSPYAEPSRYWEIQEEEAPELKSGRRRAVYFSKHALPNALADRDSVFSRSHRATRSPSRLCTEIRAVGQS